MVNKKRKINFIFLIGIFKEKKIYFKFFFKVTDASVSTTTLSIAMSTSSLILTTNPTEEGNISYVSFGEELYQNMTAMVEPVDNSMWEMANTTGESISFADLGEEIAEMMPQSGNTSAGITCAVLTGQDLWRMIATWEGIMVLVTVLAIGIIECFFLYVNQSFDGLGKFLFANLCLKCSAS